MITEARIEQLECENKVIINALKDLDSRLRSVGMNRSARNPLEKSEIDNVIDAVREAIRPIRDIR